MVGVRHRVVFNQDVVLLLYESIEAIYVSGCFHSLYISLFFPLPVLQLSCGYLMKLEREHAAIRLFVYYLLAEPLKSGYSDEQLEEVLLREENKKRHAIKKGVMYDAFIACIQRDWQSFFDPYGCPAHFDGEALLLIAMQYFKSIEGYEQCALLKRVLQYYRKKYRRWLPPLSRNKEKLERIKKEYSLRYLN